MKKSIAYLTAVFLGFIITASVYATPIPVTIESGFFRLVSGYTNVEIPGYGIWDVSFTSDAAESFNNIKTFPGANYDFAISASYALANGLDYLYRYLMTPLPAFTSDKGATIASWTDFAVMTPWRFSFFGTGEGSTIHIGEYGGVATISMNPGNDGYEAWWDPNPSNSPDYAYAVWTPNTSVPEPGSLLLMCIGLIGLVLGSKGCII